MTEFAFLTVIYTKIFNVTDLLYDIVQSKCLDINYSQRQLDSEFDKHKLAEEKVLLQSSGSQVKRIKSNNKKP